MCLFVILAFKTHNRIVLITDSYELRNTIVTQILQRQLEETPVFYRRLGEIQDSLGAYQDMLEDPDNPVFQ